MSTKNPKPSRKPYGALNERSFTLLETIVAMGILVTFIIEVSRVQGNAVIFTEYGRNVTQATWLAKSIMAKVEYYAETKVFKELETEVKEEKIDGFPDFTYTLTIKEWKLPLVDMLAGGGDKNKDTPDERQKSEVGGGASGDMIKGGISQILGDELLKIANVEVFWAEGAKRNSTQITYLLTNQHKVDEVIGTMKTVADNLGRQSQTTPGQSPGPSPGATVAPTAPVTPPGADPTDVPPLP